MSESKTDNGDRNEPATDEDKPLIAIWDDPKIVCFCEAKKVISDGNAVIVARTMQVGVQQRHLHI